MITPAYLRTMAAYNSHMNREVYAAAARLGEPARRADRGAFWRSIHGTLSHLVWADQMWMSRFDGWPTPDTLLRDSAAHIPDWAALAALRPTLDARLEDWATRGTPEWLAQDQHWFSGATQQPASRARTALVMHLFNHQTHHRGQTHALLTAAGEHTGDTDLWL